MDNDYENIPKELRSYNQWVLWKYETKEDGELTKVPYQLNGYKADPTNPKHWTTFDAVVDHKKKLNGHSGVDGIGFAFSAFDPFFGIDLDKTDNPKYFEQQLKIYNNFNSYSELSPSGNGIHIIGYGSVPAGRKRDKVEVYSSGRYFTFTGKKYNDAPIAHRQELLDILWAEMGPEVPVYEIKSGESKPQIIDDREVMKRATNAANGEKFTQLFTGNWQALYPSQSEADFALVNIIAYYTQNIEQIKRVWNLSQLSKRNKQTTIKNVPYLDHMVNRAFDQQLPEVDLAALKSQFDSMRKDQTQEGAAHRQDATPSHGSGEQALAQSASGAAGMEANNSAAAKANLLAAKALVKITPPSRWPPGLLGEIAAYIYQSAHYPCYEVALAGAVGLMAGICGRAYNVSGTGLNLYIVLLAVTGTGKEGASSGITKLMSKVKKTIPQAETFLGPGDIRSEQALVKYLSENPSFLSIYSEFGTKLKQMSSAKNETALGLRSILLKLYNKSGFNDELGKIIYSDKDKNTKTLVSPAFSLLGEGTPEEYYSSVDENSISDGFLNRFITFEYKGRRPARNKQPDTEISAKLDFNLCNLISVCLSKDSATKPIDVIITPEAAELFDKVENRLTDIINTSDSELLRKLWVRSTVKAMKLAAIPAIGINHIQPVIDRDCAKWACDIIVSDTENVAMQFNLGKVGEKSLETYSSDINQLNDMIKIIKKWIKREDIPPRADDRMQAANVYTFSALQIRLAGMASYRNYTPGAGVAFKRAIQILLDAGDIQELNQSQVKDQFDKKAKCFTIIDYERFLKA